MARPDRLLAVILALLGPGAAIAADGPVVAVTPGGQVQGEARGEGAVFRGLPFAAPPTGENRWRPPATVAPWTGVRRAVAPGPTCLQRSYGWNALDAEVSREDCLYLELRTPALKPGARLPVVVWIHGGANRAGSSRGTVESSLADQGVVLVAIQYRLGVFGFLSHPALSAEGGGASGNYALMDQIAALRWVRNNIARFGGDPGNVTIMGHSAGGQDVGLLMLAPDARGLFAKAIAQSGTPGFGLPPRTLAQNEALGLDLAKAAGAGDLTALRAASGLALLDAADGLKPPIADDSFVWLQAVVDGAVIRQPPAHTLMGGGEARVPLLIGANARELPLYGGGAEATARVREAYGANADRALELYGLKPGQVASEAVADQIAADLGFHCPARFVAARHAMTGQPTWRYVLGVAAPGDAPVRHGSELAFVFKTPPAGSEASAWPPLQAYWLNFVRTGDPNGPGLKAWSDDRNAGAAIVFAPSGARFIRDERGAFCRLLPPRP